MFRVQWRDETEDDLRALPIHQRRRVFDEAVKVLSSRPTSPPQKLIEGLKPPWANEEGFWQLTIDPYRVFYDVDEVEFVVTVRAVRYKGRNRTEDIL